MKLRQENAAARRERQAAYRVRRNAISEYGAQLVGFAAQDDEMNGDKKDLAAAEKGLEAAASVWRRSTKAAKQHLGTYNEAVLNTVLGVMAEVQADVHGGMAGAGTGAGVSRPAERGALRGGASVVARLRAWTEVNEEEGQEIWRAICDAEVHAKQLDTDADNIWAQRMQTEQAASEARAFWGDADVPATAQLQLQDLRNEVRRLEDMARSKREEARSRRQRTEEQQQTLEKWEQAKMVRRFLAGLDTGERPEVTQERQTVDQEMVARWRAAVVAQMEEVSDAKQSMDNAREEMKSLRDKVHNAAKVKAKRAEEEVVRRARQAAEEQLAGTDNAEAQRAEEEAGGGLGDAEGRDGPSKQVGERTNGFNLLGMLKVTKRGKPYVVWQRAASGQLKGVLRVFFIGDAVFNSCLRGNPPASHWRYLRLLATIPGVAIVGVSEKGTTSNCIICASKVRKTSASVGGELERYVTCPACAEVEGWRRENATLHRDPTSGGGIGKLEGYVWCKTTVAWKQRGGRMVSLVPRPAPYR